MAKRRKILDEASDVPDPSPIQNFVKLSHDEHHLFATGQYATEENLIKENITEGNAMEEDP